MRGIGLELAVILLPLHPKLFNQTYTNVQLKSPLRCLAENSTMPPHTPPQKSPNQDGAGLQSQHWKWGGSFEVSLSYTAICYLKRGRGNFFLIKKSVFLGKFMCDTRQHTCEHCFYLCCFPTTKVEPT